jgi:hypothetical protein
MDDVARWFWRAIEHETGWICRHGREELDRHPSLEEAIAHLGRIARAHAPSQVFAHYLDGRVETIALFD